MPSVNSYFVPSDPSRAGHLVPGTLSGSKKYRIWKPTVSGNEQAYQAVNSQLPNEPWKSPRMTVAAVRPTMARRA